MKGLGEVIVRGDIVIFSLVETMLVGLRTCWVRLHEIAEGD